MSAKRQLDDDLEGARMRTALTIERPPAVSG